MLNALNILMLEIYFILGLLSFAGIILGLILGMIAPEELKPGAPWFIKLKNTIFTLLILILLYYNIYNLIIIPLIIFLILYWYRGTLGEESYMLEYSMMGSLFGMGYYTPAIPEIIGLIFIYKITSGSLLIYKNNNFNFLIKSICLRLIFYIFGLLLPLMFANV